MMDFRDSDLVRRLVAEGLGAGRTAIRDAHEEKSPASSTNALSGEVKAGHPGGNKHPATTQHGEEERAGRSAMRKSGDTMPPVSVELRGKSQPSPERHFRPVLRIVVDNSRCLTMANPKRDCPRAAMVKHLVLV